MLNKIRIVIYIVLPIILISGGWGLFNEYIRPNHYQLLFPYSGFQFRESNITETNMGEDGKVKIKIPAGYAVVGKDTYQGKKWADEFWIDQIPVTVKEYKAFLEKSHYLAPRYHDEYSMYWTQKEYELLPVVFVSWGQAEDYCEYFGGHLPSELQWEKAARGPEGIVLYWDDERKAFDRANYDNFYDGKTFSGWLPAGKTQYGLLDTSGNVREWVLDWLYNIAQPVSDMEWDEIKNGEYSPLGRILKGGSYIDDVSHLRLYNRDWHDPNSPGFNRGFRCVYEK